MGDAAVASPVARRTSHPTTRELSPDSSTAGARAGVPLFLQSPTQLPGADGPLYLPRPDEALRDGEHRLDRPDGGVQGVSLDDLSQGGSPTSEATSTELPICPPIPGDNDANFSPAPISTPSDGAAPLVSVDGAGDTNSTTTASTDVSTTEGSSVATEGGDGGVFADAPSDRRAPRGSGGSDARAADAVPLDLASLDESSVENLALVDFELAEHQRWAGASAQVGSASSADRAGFVLNQIYQGFKTGAAGGLGMGATLGLLHRGLATQAASRLGARLASRMGGSSLARTGAAAQAAARMAGRLGLRLGP